MTSTQEPDPSLTLDRWLRRVEAAFGDETKLRDLASAAEHALHDDQAAIVTARAAEYLRALRRERLTRPIRRVGDVGAADNGPTRRLNA
jgi:hypothetical protein